MRPLVTSVTDLQTDSDLGKRFPGSGAIMTCPSPSDQEQHAVILLSPEPPRKITGESAPRAWISRPDL